MALASLSSPVPTALPAHLSHGSQSMPSTPALPSLSPIPSANKRSSASFDRPRHMNVVPIASPAIGRGKSPAARVKSGYVAVHGLGMTAGGNRWRAGTGWARRWAVLEENTLAVYSTDKSLKPLTRLFLTDVLRISRHPTPPAEHPSTILVTLQPSSHYHRLATSLPASGGSAPSPDRTTPAPAPLMTRSRSGSANGQTTSSVPLPSSSSSADGHPASNSASKSLKSIPSFASLSRSQNSTMTNCIPRPRIPSLPSLPSSASLPSLPLPTPLARRGAESIMLSFESDSTLYSWYDDLYERVGRNASGGGAAKVVSVVHGAGVKWGGEGKGWIVQGGEEDLPVGLRDLVKGAGGMIGSEKSKAKGNRTVVGEDSEEEEELAEDAMNATREGNSVGGRKMVRLTRNEDDEPEGEKVRAAWLLVKKPGLRGGWMWKKRWVQFADGNLVIKSRMNVTLPTQSQILPLSQLHSINRSDLKDNCLRLQFLSTPSLVSIPPSPSSMSFSSIPLPLPFNRSNSPSPKTYYLSLPTENDLHSWMEDLYARQASVPACKGRGIGGPQGFKHVVHVETGGVTVDGETLAAQYGAKASGDPASRGADQIWHALAELQGLSVEEVKRQADEAKRGAQQRRERERRGPDVGIDGLRE